MLSYDPASDTDVLAMCAASAAFCTSDIPIEQAIAGVQIVRLNGEYLINPGVEETNAAEIALVVAGSRDGITWLRVVPRSSTKHP